MIKSFITIALILTLLTFFLWATGQLAQREKIGAEWSRKIVHSGLGLVCAGFPWVFSATWELVVLYLGVLLLLLAARYLPAVRARIGLSLYGIQRRSVGDLLFGVAVVVLFHVTASDRALYVLPLLILTLSDSAAALVGTYYGRHSFVISGGQKSWEGCAAFFVTTFVLTLLVLGTLTSLDWPHLLLIAFIVSLIGSMVEAVSWHGWDNLFVPLGLLLLLRALIGQPALALLAALTILMLLIVSIRRLSRFTSLDTHALMGALLAAYFFWETGGLEWLMPPVIVFVIHVMLSCLQGIKENESYRISAVISIVSAGIFWRFADLSYSAHYAYYAFAVSMAIHLQIMILLRIRNRQGTPSQYSLVALIACLSWWLFMPLLMTRYAPLSHESYAVFLFGLFIMAAGGMFFRVESGDIVSADRWREQGRYALLGSLLAFLPVLFYQP